MTEEQQIQQETSSFTRGGSVPDNITLAQAGEMALRTAQATPSRRRWLISKRMFFDVLNDYEDENSYTIVVGFRPHEVFDGTPGQERFIFSKTGMFQNREVLSHPKSSKRFQIKRKTAVLSVLAIAAIIGLVVLGFVIAPSAGCTSRPFC